MVLKKPISRLNDKVKIDSCLKSLTNNFWTEKLSYFKFYFSKIFFKTTIEKEYGHIRHGKELKKDLNDILILRKTRVRGKYFKFLRKKL